MISASKEFKEKLKSGANIVNYADIALNNGTVLNLTYKDFMIGGCNISDKTTDGKFGVGFTIGKTLTMRIANHNERFSGYDFYNSIIILYVAMLMDDGSIEKIRKGKFYTTVPEAPGDIIEINAVDGMYLLDKDYSNCSTAYPATLQTIISDACLDCGIQIGFAQFDNMNFVVREKPENATYRQVLSWAAQIAGYNARIDNNGYMQLVWYDTSLLTDRIYDGGNFKTYPHDTVIDGGNFTDYSTDTIISGGTFADKVPEYIFRIKSIDVHTDDVQITGIRVIDDNKTEALFGEEGYVIEIKNNPLANNAVQEVADYLGSRMVGMVFRPFTAQILNNPLYEPFEVVKLTDRKGNLYYSLINSISYTIGAYTQIACEAEDPVRNGSTYYSQAASAVVEARRNTERQLTTYDKAVQNMNQLAANAMGLYRESEKQSDDSYIYYQSNKPIMVDEDGKCHFEAGSIVYKSAAEGFFVSTDGGESYASGFDAEGNAVVNVLSAIGIQFDWAKGGTLSLGGDNNTNGVINIFDKNNVLCGRIDNEGIYIFSPGTSRYVIISPTTGFRYHTTGGTFLGAFFSTTVQFTPDEIERTVSPGTYGTLKNGTDYPRQTGPIKTLQIGYFQDNDTASRTRTEVTETVGGMANIVVGYNYTYRASHSNVVFPCSSNAFDPSGAYRNSYSIIRQNMYGNTPYAIHHMSIELPEDFKYATDIDVQIDFTWNNPYVNGQYADKIFGLKFTANKDAYLPSCANGVSYSRYYELIASAYAPTAESWLMTGPRAYTPTNITSGSVQKPSSYAKSEANKQDDSVRFQIIKASDVNIPAVLPETYQIYPVYSYNLSSDNATLELDVGIAVDIHSSVLGTGAIDLTECFQIYVGLSA